MIIILILIIIYLLLEIFIYFFLKKYQSIKWIIFNQKIELNHKKFKNFKKNVYDEKLGWDYKFLEKKKNFITKSGFRKSRYSQRKKKILAYGDSYTFCRQVKDDQTWENIISKTKKTFVANYGVGNYGLDQAFLKFSLKKKSKDNKIIIFGFVPETICRIQSCWKHYLEFGNINGFKPSVNLKNNNLKFRDNFLKKKIDYSQLHKIINKVEIEDRFYKDKFIRYNFSLPYVFSFLKNISFNFEVFAKILFTKKKSLIEENLFPIIMKYNIKFSHKLYNEDYSKKLMSNLIIHISKILKLRKIDCYFVIFPQLYDLKLKTRVNYQSFFKNFKNQKIIDLTSNFLKQKNINSLYINDKYGGHLSYKGNKLVAKELIKEIYKTD